MSMDGLREGASNINHGKGKGAVRSAYFVRYKPPQMLLTSGKGSTQTTFDLHPFLAPPPHEEAKIEAAEPIVLIPGDYEDIYAQDANGTRIVPPPKQEGLHIRVHNFNVYMKPRNPNEKGYNSFRELVCSAGPEPHAPQPCLGCYQVDHGDKEAKPKDNWAFNIAHLSWYHRVPLIKDGQIQIKKDGSGPVMLKVECPNYKMESVYLGRAVQAGRAPADVARRYKRCEACDQRAEYTWGEHRTLQVGFKHLKNIFAIDDEVGKKCINCGTGILRAAFDCEHCHTELLDLSRVSWTNDQIDQYMKTTTECQACRHFGLPKSVYECGFDDNYNIVADPCSNPKRTSIFDCVLWVQREGKSTESEIVVRRVELISQYKTQDGRPLADHLKEIVKEPFDLAEMYKPESLDDQADLVKIPNPFAQQQPAQYTNYSTYNNGQQPGWQGQAPGYDQQYQPPGGPGGYVPPQPQTGPQQPQQPAGYPQPGRPNYGR